MRSDQWQGWGGLGGRSGSEQAVLAASLNVIEKTESAGDILF